MNKKFKQFQQTMEKEKKGEQIMNWMLLSGECRKWQNVNYAEKKRTLSLLQKKEISGCAENTIIWLKMKKKKLEVL